MYWTGINWYSDFIPNALHLYCLKNKWREENWAVKTEWSIDYLINVLGHFISIQMFYVDWQSSCAFVICGEIGNLDDHSGKEARAVSEGARFGGILGSEHHTPQADVSHLNVVLRTNGALSLRQIKPAFPFCGEETISPLRASVSLFTMWSLKYLLALTIPHSNQELNNHWGIISSIQSPWKTAHLWLEWGHFSIRYLCVWKESREKTKFLIAYSHFTNQRRKCLLI